MVDPEQKEKFLEGLREYPNLTVMAARCGISKATVFRWKKEDAEFAKGVQVAMKNGRETITDLAEGKLISAIKKGERWAITTWLEAHSRRFYRPRKPMTAPRSAEPLTGLRIEIVDPTKMTKEEYDRMREETRQHNQDLAAWRMRDVETGPSEEILP